MPFHGSLNYVQVTAIPKRFGNLDGVMIVSVARVLAAPIDVPKSGGSGRERR